MSTICCYRAQNEQFISNTCIHIFRTAPKITIICKSQNSANRKIPKNRKIQKIAKIRKSKTRAASPPTQPRPLPRGLVAKLPRTNLVSPQNWSRVLGHNWQQSPGDCGFSHIREVQKSGQGFRKKLRKNCCQQKKFLGYQQPSLDLLWTSSQSPRGKRTGKF